MGRRVRALRVGGLVPFLLLTAVGCAAEKEALRPAGASSTVRTRVPPAETIGFSFRGETRPAPPRPLPLTEADKTGARTPAAPGVGWIKLIEVSFSVSLPPEPADRRESVARPETPAGSDLSAIDVDPRWKESGGE